jgi:hypothetical protein
MGINGKVGLSTYILQPSDFTISVYDGHKRTSVRGLLIASKKNSEFEVSRSALELHKPTHIQQILKMRLHLRHLTL